MYHTQDILLSFKKSLPVNTLSDFQFHLSVFFRDVDYFDIQAEPVAVKGNSVRSCESEGGMMESTGFPILVKSLEKEVTKETAPTVFAHAAVSLFGLLEEGYTLTARLAQRLVERMEASQKVSANDNFEKLLKVARALLSDTNVNDGNWVRYPSSEMDSIRKEKKDGNFVPPFSYKTPIAEMV